MNRFTHLVVHHSGGPRSQSVAAVRRYHMAPKPRGKGWADIGYHHIVDGRAKLHVGRRLPATGAHAPPNNGRIGLLVMGNNLDEDEAWTLPQIFMMADVVKAYRFLMPWLEFDGHGTIMPGHTKCPGTDLAEFFEAVGIKVA